MLIGEEFKQVFENLRWQKTNVGSDGHVCLVDVMGDESAIVQAARVSYGVGTKQTSDDASLIRYLVRHRHTTPLEMVELKFRVRVPMEHWRQWIRHRTASVNEYSTRYSEAIDSRAVTDPEAWRLQSTINKQGSGGTVVDWPAGYACEPVNNSGDNDIKFVVTTPSPRTSCIASDREIAPGEYLSAQEARLHAEAEHVYKERLDFGVAREQARKDLPLSTYTEAYWKIDLHNLLHFLSLRMDSHAQLEIREFANAIGEIVATLYPTVWQAFKEYRLNAMTLTTLDQYAVGCLATYSARTSGNRLTKSEWLQEQHLHPSEWQNLKSCRERDECAAK
jgi:thymidylate synthase (FAD)